MFDFKEHAVFARTRYASSGESDLNLDRQSFKFPKSEK